MSCRSLHAAGQQGPTAENRASFPFDNPLLSPLRPWLTVSTSYFPTCTNLLHLQILVLLVTVPNVSLLPGKHTTHRLDNTHCRQA